MRRLILAAVAAAWLCLGFLFALAPGEAASPAQYGDELFGGWTAPSTWPTATPALVSLPGGTLPAACLHSQYVRGEDRCTKGEWTEWEYLFTLSDPTREVKCHVLEDEQLGRRLDDSPRRQYLLKRSTPNGGTVCRYWTRVPLP